MPTRRGHSSHPGAGAALPASSSAQEPRPQLKAQTEGFHGLMLRQGVCAPRVPRPPPAKPEVQVHRGGQSSSKNISYLCIKVSISVFVFF